MKLTVVGFWGGFPQANEASSGYLLEENGFTLLIDCGSAVLSMLQQYIQIMELDAIILSHYHHDHIADIGPMQYARMVNTYLGKGDQILPIYSHPYDQPGFNSLTKQPYTKGVPYDPNKELKIGPFSITFLKTKHPVTCYAMRISNGKKSFVYTADSSYLQEFIDFSRGTDLLISECNFYEDQDGSNSGHMTSTEAGTIANDAEVGELLLTHLPHFGNHQDLISQAKVCFNGPVQLAQSGLVKELL